MNTEAIKNNVPDAYVDLYRLCYIADDEETAEAAALLAGVIDYAFNPSDGEEAQEALLMRAVLNAAQYIERQPCTCDDPWENGPCDRCQALGRIANVRQDR